MKSDEMWKAGQIVCPVFMEGMSFFIDSEEGNIVGYLGCVRFDKFDGFLQHCLCAAEQLVCQEKTNDIP